MSVTADLPQPFEAKLLIGGSFASAADGKTFDVVDPATEEVIAQVPSAGPSDIDQALVAASSGLRSLKQLSAWDRSACLRQVSVLLRDWADDIARIMTREQGKPLAEARAEVLASADQFDWYADEARRIYGRTVDGHSTSQRIIVRRDPIGVVAAFTAWNFPALLPSRKIAAAVAAGCSIIVKPAGETPLTAMAIGHACTLAGLPDGVVQVLTGSSSEISERLLANPVVRKVSLTGSVEVGKALIRASADQMQRVSMELGGHAPVLIFEDADIEEAAQACAASKFRNAGQVCASPSRFFAHESIADEFAAAFARHAGALKVGSGLDPETQMGPLSNRRRLEAAEGLIEDALSGGAKVLAGGGRLPEFDRGYFFAPTVLSGVDSSMRIMNDEPFAPVAPVAAFQTLDEALELANQTEYGLASYLFTGSLQTAFRASEGIEAGMVGVNSMLIATAEAPFGGIKQSGFGREGGTEGVDDYTVVKYINLTV